MEVRQERAVEPRAAEARQEPAAALRAQVDPIPVFTPSMEPTDELA